MSDTLHFTLSPTFPTLNSQSRNLRTLVLSRNNSTNLPIHYCAEESLVLTGLRVGYVDDKLKEALNK